MSSHLTVTRPAQLWGDRARKYRIYIDGDLIGKIAQESSIRTEVSPGPHRIQAKVDWSGSPEIVVTIEPDSNLTVRVIKNVESRKRLLLTDWLKLEVGPD
jgi:hypothetical protein